MESLAIRFQSLFSNWVEAAGFATQNQVSQLQRDLEAVSERLNRLADAAEKPASPAKKMTKQRATKSTRTSRAAD